MRASPPPSVRAKRLKRLRHANYASSIVRSSGRWSGEADFIPAVTPVPVAVMAVLMTPVAGAVVARWR